MTSNARNVLNCLSYTDFDIESRNVGPMCISVTLTVESYCARPQDFRGSFLASLNC